MRTTIDLPDKLLVEAKKKAAEEHTTLRALLENGLRAELRRVRPGVPRKGKLRIRFVTVDGGLPPEIDVSDRAGMHDWIRRQR